MGCKFYRYLNLVFQQEKILQKQPCAAPVTNAFFDLKLNVTDDMSRGSIAVHAVCKNFQINSL
jgi:hypothetical protein